jgi:TRAP-type C4-dicarboxylate transport system substrate-binding protein
LPSFQQSKHYEVCRYYCMDEHTRVPDLLLMSSHVWDRLSAEEQGWVRQAAAASARRQRQLWAEAEALALREIEAAGVAVLRPDPAPFAQQLAPFLADSRQDSLLGPLLRLLEDSLASLPADETPNR